MAQFNADDTSTCISCINQDDSNMVTCSKCLGSYHRTCCGIGEAVDMFAWSCANCTVFCPVPNLNSREQVLASTAKQNDPVSLQPLASRQPFESQQPRSRQPLQSQQPLESQQPLPSSINITIPQTDSSAGRSRKIQLQLQQLEEEMLLRQEFLRRKYDLLYAHEEGCHEITDEAENQIVRPVEGNTNYSQITNAPCVQNIQQTNIEMIQNNDESSDIATNHNNEHHRSVNNLPIQSELIARRNSSNNSPILNPSPQQHQEAMYVNRVQNRGEYVSLAQTPTITDAHNIPQGQSTHIHPPNRSHVNDQELNIPNIINQNNTSIGCQNHDVNKTISFGNLTTTQLVARQSISRDLPLFNGDPKEWPIFFSAFEQSSRVAGYSNDENLIRLQKSLQGKAREAVRNCLMLPDMVPDIMRTLKMYFGRPECVLKNVIDEVRKMSLQKGKLESLAEFAFAVKNICATIRASQLDDYLNNPTLLQELVDKLSPETVLLWAMHSRDIRRPNLMDFSNWLYNVAEATCRVTVPVFHTSDKKQFRSDGRLNTHTDSNQQTLQQQCIVCNESHKVTQCTRFKELTTVEKWDIVKSNNLCRICLGKHRRRCWFKKHCGVNGCTVLHNALLHEEEGPVSILNNHKNDGESYFRIVPVTLHSDTKTITIYALMDDGSTLTLLEESVADSLGVQGVIDPLCIRWTGNVSRYEDSSRRLSLNISSTENNSKIFPLQNVYTVKNLNLTPETLNVDELKNKFPHLKDIPLKGYKNAIPSMIIGVNNPNLISSMKSYEGDWQQPVAVKTRLGWTIFGGGSKAYGRLHLHKCSCEELHHLVKQYFSDESVSITPPTTMPLSKDDERAMEILNKTCKIVDGRYEVGLLWKLDSPRLPNSLPMAIKRLQCLQQRTSRDPTLAKMVKDQILNLVEKGYAERLPLSVLKQHDDKVWYMPTFIVKNPQKPNKIRLVWDAAAKSGDIALNDFLLKGPDLLRPLINVIYKFREGAIAICGDIAEMFHRIRVRKEDSVAQRFLWMDSNNAVVVYQLNVLTFGASCSPCISHFVRDKNAQNFGEDIRTIEAITKQHYVDDYIDSASTIEDAIHLALSVRDIHAKGGFHMRNWASNSAEVLEALGETNALNRTFENKETLTQFEKILGLYWDPKSDVFKINVKFVRLRRPILNADIVPTKREVLQVLMSVFDPLGFVVCFMTYLKSILQEIWRCGIDWDQPLNEDLFCKWKNWLTFLPVIANVSIPRCYSMAIQRQNYRAELHTFVDASEDAYGAVSYFRIEVGDHVEIRLVSAKAKVAPLRPLSVPRLELQAATIGARLAKAVSSHNINLDRTVMWTDSKTVLSWIAGDPRRYKQFVMFRIAEILKFTSIKDWRWVPSALNVADFATKYRPASNNYNEWFEGPSWLKLPETDWPTSTNEHDIVSMDTTEIRHRYLHIHTRLTMCYQRLSGNTNHNNVDHKPTHLPPGHYVHGHRWNEPYFDVTMPKNITSLVGKSAYLGCRVKHLGNKTVAWIRHRDLHILTVGTYTYTTDQRFQTSYHRDIDEWTLQIKWAQQRDAGVYECQISTQPVRSFSVNLNIVDSLDSEQSDMMQQFFNDDSFIISHDRIYQSGDDEFAGMFGPIQTIAVPTATILGGPDLYVDKGSTINLTCVIKFSTEPPTHIFWYHQDKVLSEETSGGRLKFKTIKAEETKSILLIDDATLLDSGKYSCYPSNTEIASIRVHVLQGERPEAMQTNAAAATKVQSSNPFGALTVFVATFALWHALASIYTRTLNTYNSRSSSNGTIKSSASSNKKSGNSSNVVCNINSKSYNCSDANGDDDDTNNSNNDVVEVDGDVIAGDDYDYNQERVDCAPKCNSCGNCGPAQQNTRKKVLHGDNFNTCIFPSYCNQRHVLR